MASKRWWPVLALLFVLSVLFRQYVLTAILLMLGMVSGLAQIWQKYSLDNVSYRRKLFYRRGFPGEKIDLRLEVENRKLLPVSWLKITDPWPFPVGPEDENLLAPTHLPDEGLLINLFSLRWFERNRRSYTLMLRQRGVYRIGPPLLESGDLFGFFQQTKEVDNAEYLTVFPTPVSFESLQLPSNDPFGDRKARRRVYEDPNQPMGIRDYHPEDDFRHIHWPATAHTNELQVKVYRPVSGQVMVVCLNASTLSRYWEGTNPELLEHLLGVTSTLVQYALENGYRVGMISNGCLAHAGEPFRVPPGRTVGQLARLLATLASVTPFVTGPFERFLTTEVPRLPFGSTLVIVTSVTSPSMGETIYRLKRYGHQVTLISFDRRTPPTVPNVQVVHRPFIS